MNHSELVRYYLKYLLRVAIISMAASGMTVEATTTDTVSAPNVVVAQVQEFIPVHVSQTDRVYTQLVCFGELDNWKNQKFFRVYAKLKDLLEVAPEIFISPSINEINCIASGFQHKIPYNLQLQINAIYQEIEHQSPELYGQLRPQEQTALQSIQQLEHHKESPEAFKIDADRTLLQKLVRAEQFVISGQILILGTFLILPRDFTRWPKTITGKVIRDNLKAAWSTVPQWDHDPWYVNFVAHPYSGAFYYNALRDQGEGMLASFIYTTFQSSFWEYTIEATMERPSRTDLIVTPLVGSLMGELGYRATMSMKKNGFKWWEKGLVILLNPAYALNNGFK